MPTNIVDASTWTTPLAVPNNGEVANQSSILSNFAQGLANRTTFLRGSHKIQNFELSTYQGSESTVNQTFTGGAGSAAFTAFDTTFTNLIAGDKVILLAQFRIVCASPTVGYFECWAAHDGVLIDGSRYQIDAASIPDTRGMLFGMVACKEFSGTDASAQFTIVGQGQTDTFEWKGSATLIAVLLRAT